VTLSAKHRGLVGRERELGALRRALEAACEGRPRLVLCRGEPGIGKTRLASELTDLALAEGVSSLWGRAPEGVAAAPFWLWSQVFRADPAALAPATTTTEDPEAARFVLFDAVRERLRDEAERHGLLVVLDDVQRADEPSLLLLRHVVRELRNERLMVLATERTLASEATPGWQAVRPDLVQEPVTEQVQLGGLSIEDTIRCAAAVTGYTIDARAGRDLHRATKGNPFFVTELARARAGDDRAVPGSVFEVVGRRVANLQPATGRLLAAAAVLGEQFPLPVAASLIDRPVAACLPLLEEAASAGLVETATVAGDWRFSHALVRDAVEARIPLAARVDLHRAAAEAMERTYADQLNTRLADLARHWSVVATTGDRGNAIRWARLAAEEAMRLLAYEESARLYHLALDCAGPELELEPRCRLLLDLAQAEWRSGHLEAAQATCQEIVDLARRAGRPHLLADAALTLEPIGALVWDLDLVPWCKEALAGVDEGDVRTRARLLARLSEASIYAGDDEAALETSAQALALADQVGDVTAVVAALRARQLALSGPEHGVERMVLADRMIDAGLVLRRPSIEMWGRLWRIDVHWERGELPAIASETARLEWCVRHVGGPLAQWHLLTARAGLAQATAGFDEACRTGFEAFQSVQTIRHPTAFGAYASLMCAVGHHIGHDRAWGEMLPGAMSPPPVDPGEVRGAIFSHVGPALVLVESGRRDEALAAFPQGRSCRPLAAAALLPRTGVGRGIDRGDRVGPARGRRVLRRPAGLRTGTARRRGCGQRLVPRARGAAPRARRCLPGPVGRGRGGPACRRRGVPGHRGDGVRSRGGLRAGPGARAERRRRGEGAGHPATSRGRPARHGPLGATGRCAAVDVGGRGGPVAARGEVARLVAEGKTNRAIAEELFMSERTAQTHVQHILTKLGLSNRTQIAAWMASKRQE